MAREPTRASYACAFARAADPAHNGPSFNQGLGQRYGPLGPGKKTEVLGSLENGLHSPLAQAKAHCFDGSLVSQNSPQQPTGGDAVTTELLRRSFVAPSREVDMSEAFK